MITYTYIVRCPECEDEFFDFFDEAKDFAMGCLTKKPIITQTEVQRNDFGECTDHCDLGTVWSWEDMMRKETDAEPAISVFTKDDLKCMADGKDPEFDDIDNSVDFEPETSEVSAIDEVPDNFKKPISENASKYGGFRTDGYRTALACYDTDDFDINVEFGMQDEEEYEVEDYPYLLKPGQTVADLVVYLSRECGFTNIYVYFERSATRAEIKSTAGFETVPGNHDYRHYGTIEDRLVEKCNKQDRKPIPEGMTIEQLVEEMEANEDTVECSKCGNLVEKADCHHNQEGFGWCCNTCEPADTLVEAQEEYELAAIVKDSINHLTNDIGKDPWAKDFADDVIADIENNYDVEVPEDLAKYNSWANSIASEVSRQVNNPIDEEVEPEELHDLGNTYDGGYPEDEELTEASLADITAAANSEFDTDWNTDDLLDFAGVGDDFRRADIHTGMTPSEKAKAAALAYEERAYKNKLAAWKRYKNSK